MIPRVVQVKATPRAVYLGERLPGRGPAGDPAIRTFQDIGNIPVLLANTAPPASRHRVGPLVERGVHAWKPGVIADGGDFRLLSCAAGSHADDGEAPAWQMMEQVTENVAGIASSINLVGNRSLCVSEDLSNPRWAGCRSIRKNID